MKIESNTPETVNYRANVDQSLRAFYVLSNHVLSGVCDTPAELAQVSMTLTNRTLSLISSVCQLVNRDTALTVERLRSQICAELNAEIETEAQSNPDFSEYVYYKKRIAYALYTVDARVYDSKIMQFDAYCDILLHAIEVVRACSHRILTLHIYA